MRTSFRNLLIVLFSFIVFSLSAIAEEWKDHPLMNSLPGSKINGYDHVDYEEMNILLSKPYKKGGKWVADKIMPVEGKITYIHYRLASKYSALQAFRNYQKAAARQNMEVLFNCERKCIAGNLSDLDDLIGNHRDLYLNYGEQNQILVAKKRNYYLMLFVAEGSGAKHVFQFVIEKESVNDTLISPIAESLKNSGRIDLYGIYFDTGKSKLKSKSSVEIGDIATFLNDYPEVNIEIVGHTDNVGSTKTNKTLSLARAKAVQNSLVHDHAIARSRLKTLGMGEGQALESNDTKGGRAKNRRVEVVVLNREVLSGEDSSGFSGEKKTKKLEKKKQKEDTSDSMSKTDKALKKLEKAKSMKDRFKRLF